MLHVTCKCKGSRGNIGYNVFYYNDIDIKYDHLQDKMSVGGIWDISTPPSDI